MKVYLASNHLAQSTLAKKVQVYLRKSELPKKKGATKAQALRWVEKIVPTPEEDTETNPLKEFEQIRSTLRNEHTQEFNAFMEEHEERIGITREHLLQASYGDIADGESSGGSPIQWLTRMILALADKAEGVLTINQQLAQERTQLKNQVGRLDETNKTLAKENDKLLLKLKELNERLTDQSASREIYEKEAVALREQLTETHQKRVSKMIADGAERIKENDRKGHGPVRAFSNDPDWKYWWMVIKACPKCHGAAAAFPERTVGCAQNCTAKDGAESMDPEAWNEWALDYDGSEEKATDKKPAHSNGIATKVREARARSKVHPEEDIEDLMGNHRPEPQEWDEHDPTEVDMPARHLPTPPQDIRPVASDALEGRVMALEERVKALLNTHQTLASVLARVVEHQAGAAQPATPRLEDRLEQEMAKAKKLRGSTFGDLPAAEVSDTVVLWGVALKRVLDALRQQKDPETACSLIETALDDLL